MFITRFMGPTSYQVTSKFQLICGQQRQKYPRLGRILGIGFPVHHQLVAGTNLPNGERATTRQGLLLTISATIFRLKLGKSIGVRGVHPIAYP